MRKDVRGEGDRKKESEKGEKGNPNTNFLFLLSLFLSFFYFAFFPFSFLFFKYLSRKSDK